MAYGMTQARRDPLSRLDAWVIEELEALSRPQPKARKDERPRRRRDVEPGPDFAEAANDGPLPMDENQFIQQVSEWLSGRPNADLILEEIWRNVVVPEADEGRAAADAGDDLGDLGDEDLGEEGLGDEISEAPLAAEGADLETEAPEGPAGDAAHDEPQA